MNRLLRIALLTALVAGVTLALRLPFPEARPLHGDEANQIVRTGHLLETGEYHYDPTDHHGPVLYYCAWPVVRVFGGPAFADSEIWMYRLVPVLFALATVLLTAGLGIWKFNGVFPGHRSLFLAALFAATSPGLVYYSRYFIQETQLVFFLLGMGVALRYYAYWPSWRSALLFGFCGGCALACKETALLAFFAMAVAAWTAFGVHRIGIYWRTKHILIAVLTLMLTTLLWFSSFLTHPQGVVDALATGFGSYAARATGTPEHTHPWWFYFQTFFAFRYGKGPFWSEAGLLLPAVLAGIAAFRKGGSRALRFVTVYTVVQAAVYAAIPYKTPWCALGFLHGVTLLAGAGIGVAWDGLRRHRLRVPGRVAVALFVVVVCAWQARQACRACFELPADPRNPYVYAHTAPDAMKLVARIEQLCAPAAGLSTPIAVALPPSDTWPLPFYLRRYTRIGYWTALQDIPADFRPRIAVVPAQMGDALPPSLGAVTGCRYFAIRPGVLLALLSLDPDGGRP